jgi:hypothetical protein
MTKEELPRGEILQRLLHIVHLEVGGKPRIEFIGSYKLIMSANISSRFKRDKEIL